MGDGRCEVLFVIELLGVLSPRSEVIFIQHDAVPLHRFNPPVGGFDSSRAVCSEHVLEGGEADEAPIVFDRVEFSVLLFFNKFPSLKVLVRHQILFPSIFHRRFEREHQHVLPFHSQCELIGGERLSESHFSVPEKVRCFPSVCFVGGEGIEIGDRLLNGVALFGSHFEVLCSCEQRGFVFSDCFDGLQHLPCVANEPFSLRVGHVCIFQHAVHRFVCEDRSVLSHGGAHEFHFPRLPRHESRIVFFHSDLHFS